MTASALASSPIQPRFAPWRTSGSGSSFTAGNNANFMTSRSICNLCKNADLPWALPSPLWGGSPWLAFRSSLKVRLDRLTQKTPSVGRGQKEVPSTGNAMAVVVASAAAAPRRTPALGRGAIRKLTHRRLLSQVASCHCTAVASLAEPPRRREIGERCRSCHRIARYGCAPAFRRSAALNGGSWPRARFAYGRCAATWHELMGARIAPFTAFFDRVVLHVSRHCQRCCNNA
jgi:hypothetical protein